MEQHTEDEEERESGGYEKDGVVDRTPNGKEEQQQEWGGEGEGEGEGTEEDEGEDGEEEAERGKEDERSEREGHEGDGSGVRGGFSLSLTQMPGLNPEQLRQESCVPSRVESGFQRRSVAVRERAELKAANAEVRNSAGTNSPFGRLHSPSASSPFINAFASSSPSNALQLRRRQSEVPPAAAQNGRNGASYDPVREASVQGFRDETLVSSIEEQQVRNVSGRLPEQLRGTAGADKHYTTFPNSELHGNHTGLKNPTNSVHDFPGGRHHRIMKAQVSAAELSLRVILSDPVTGALMDDAMLMSCGHSVGKGGLRRVLETSVCITCGASLRTETMTPNYALRSAVQAYKQEEELAGNIGIKPVKRRRDIAQENTRNEDQPVPDSTRMKGVQFPFVVGDRVMIKGNKRTPDRFVGREAVITTHCLNGWYLVRTLDNGESVRLQYRSLQKSGGQNLPRVSPTWTVALRTGGA
ncbi:hypothetical protein BDL97_09G093900 [Sphagnum fallax]|nr:hypothetical protein BDL97_09G093900 [Sphagnum fallax]KAH8952615.1 hypothetical protein BDL97_09G093900 [Sphagnum fallax]